MLLFLCTYYQSGNVVTPVTPECFLMTAFLLAVSNSFTQQGTGQMACRYMLETGSHMRWQRGQDKNSAFGKRITHGLPPTDQLVKYEAPSDHAYHTAGFFWTYQAYRQTVRAEIHRELEMVHLRSSPSRSRSLAVGQPRIAVSW
ncbi:uncharacterized protein LOC129143943 isoform X2 [Pan troglodytes]|uniref:uncharacterized protein LOC129143943 isoform X2 n=1 Tax=Pan troglodytes TaxID=9598 RepID=UPI003013322D